MVIFITAGIIGGFVVLLSLYAYLTNPYAERNILKHPFEIIYRNGQIDLKKRFEVRIKKAPYFILFAYYKCAFHIIANVYAGSKKANGSSVRSIVKKIHALRFNPRRLYVISGDHFNVLYPRNLGVFYHPVMDSRFALSEEDWRDRQTIYLKSVAYALAVFAKYRNITTTIVPTAPHSATCVNIYAYPSDAIYGVLFGLKALLDPSEMVSIYPCFTEHIYTLETKDAARELLSMYHKQLKHLLKTYLETVYDTKKGFVSEKIHLSGAKDITKRTSAFYDNVIVWKTMKLADELGIQRFDEHDLSDYKARILERYWNDVGGFFLEDMSPKSLKKKYYSSDWLVVLFTGFLNAGNEYERIYLERSVEYIQAEKLDIPFGLKYQQSDRASRQFPVVRMFVPAYGGSSIWSFWGAEYIKLLTILYRETKKDDYLQMAKRQLELYKKNILKYKGYPELYTSKGKMLSNIFYKSVRQTGWVVNLEQAESMIKAAEAEQLPLYNESRYGN